MLKRILCLFFTVCTVVSSIELSWAMQTDIVVLANEVEINCSPETEVIELGQMTSEYKYVQDESQNTIDVLVEEVEHNVGGDTSEEIEQIGITKEFATGRLMLGINSDVEVMDAVAKTDVIGDGFVVLQYESAEEAKEAYDYYMSLDMVDYVEADSDMMAVSDCMSWGYEEYCETNKSINYIPFNNKYQSNYSNDEIDVAVIDTGVSTQNKLFSGRMSEKAKDFTEDNGNAIDKNGHGTHCAGTIVEATPSNVKIMPVKVINDNGKGSVSQVVSGIIWATDNGAKVINLSISGQNTGKIDAIDQAIKYAYDHNVIVCVAAGNTGVDAKNVSPGNSPYTITVGATDNSGNMASFSNYGDTLDVVAPGVGIKSVGVEENQYIMASGTSQATTHVVATAALFCCVDNSYNYDSCLNTIKLSGKINDFSDYELKYIGSDGDNYCVTRLLLGDKTLQSNSSVNLSKPKYIFDEGRDYSSIFDPEFYLNTYADVRRAYGNDYDKALEHFEHFGMSEGRLGNEDFDVYAYRARYSDLKKAFGTNWKSLYMHYLNYGIKEKRSGKAGASYSVTFCDNQGKKIDVVEVKYGHTASTATIVKNGATMTFSTPIDTIVSNKQIAVNYHYFYKGIDYAPIFDVDYYLDKYIDIKRTYGTNYSKVLEHFVIFGMKEGRQGCSDFDVYAYRARYGDLQRAFGKEYKSIYMHYIYFGMKERRNGRPGEKSIVTFCNNLGNILQKVEVEYGHTASVSAIVKHGATMTYSSPIDTIIADKSIKVTYHYYYKGIDYGPIFDADYYINKYIDINRTFGKNYDKVLEHFVVFGMKEGRIGNGTFNVYAYRERYDDLKKAFGKNWKNLYIHYLNFGIKEGRQSC